MNETLWEERLWLRMSKNAWVSEWVLSKSVALSKVVSEITLPLWTWRWHTIPVKLCWNIVKSGQNPPIFIRQICVLASFGKNIVWWKILVFGNVSRQYFKCCGWTNFSFSNDKPIGPKPTFLKVSPLTVAAP